MFNRISRRELKQVARSNLFRQLFIWFFGVSLAVLIATVFITRALSSRTDNLEALGQDVTRAVIETYTHEGMRGIERLHDEIRDRWKTNLYLEYRQRVLGTRPVPQPVLDHVPRLDNEVLRRTLKRGEELLVVPLTIQGDAAYHLILFQPQKPDNAWTLSNWLAVQITVSMLAIAIVGLWIARHFAKPLTATDETVRRIAHGDLQARIHDSTVERNDEFGRLARGVNDMAGRIEALLQDRDRLLHDVSHELRSPLARLRILLELARSGEQEELGTQLDKADNEIARIDRLVDEILSYARATHASNSIALESVELNTLTAAVLESARVEADAQQVMLRVEELDSATIRGNEALLTRALDNLLRNAIRFSKPGDVIRVSVIQKNRQVTLSVRDDGPGVPEDQLTHIFQPFFRIPGAERGKGYGLGLALVQRVAELHGAKLQAKNGSEKGLTVSLQFNTARPS